MNHAMRLLTSQFFRHLRALLSNNSLYALDDDRIVKWNALRPTQFNSPAFSFMLALLSH